MTCRNDGDRARLCETFGWTMAGLAGDAGLSSVGGRLARRAEIDTLLTEWCMTRTADAAAVALQSNGVPAGKVQEGGDLMADPQLVARDFWRACDQAVFGERPYDRFPALWSETGLEPYLPSGAFIGEHNFEVYRDGGMSEEDIATGIGDGLFG